MPIKRLISSIAFGPEQIREIVSAYEDVLAELDLTDRTDPTAELVAKKILESAATGEIDRQSLRQRTLAAFNAPSISPSLNHASIPQPLQQHEDKLAPDEGPKK